LDELATKRDLEELLEAISRIPALGTTGIVAAIILLVLLVSVWIYAKKLQEKIGLKANDNLRAADQAENEAQNRDASREWADANNRVEAWKDKAASQTGTDPRPEEPKV
jgi:flagellar biosynthesis/type III secretory pathway M-ring protein FliF/YscJ